MSDERAKHIAKVLRLKKGDSFRAGIVNGCELMCTVEEIDESGIKVKAEKGEDLSSLYPLTLLLAQVRPICMRRILREAVSLGVGRIMLFISDLGEKSYSEASLYKSGEYLEIMKDGAMQSGFTGIPEVSFYKNLAEALNCVEEQERILLDNVIGAERLSMMKLSGTVVLAIGPERGFTDNERLLMLSHGFRPALLGKRILRTETAAVAGIGLALAGMDMI